MVLRTVVLLAGLSPAVLAAQGPPRAVRDPEPMRRLAWLAGRWQGLATYQLGPGGSRTANQTEIVEAHADGAVLAIDGLGLENGDTVHHAFAVINYDAAAKQYRIRTFLKNGIWSDPEIQVADGRIVWGFSAQGRTVRYTIVRTPAGEWHETGEWTMDGTTWRPFIEMRLRRQPPVP